MATLTHGDAQDLLESFKRGWEKRNPDTILELFAEHADYRSAPFTDSLIGANAIRAHWNQIAEQHIHVDFEPEHIWVSGRAVLASWHAAYTLRSTSERIRAYGFLTMELGDDGRIERLRQWPIERVVGRDETFHAEGGEQ